MFEDPLLDQLLAQLPGQVVLKTNQRSVLHQHRPIRGQCIITCGHVLEHEAGSLFPAQPGLPPPGGGRAYPAKHGLCAVSLDTGPLAWALLDVVNLATRHLLPIDEQGERGVLDNLLAEGEGQVMPLALLHDVREPHPGPPLPRELGLPVIVLISARLLATDDDGLVPGTEVTLE